MAKAIQTKVEKKVEKTELVKGWSITIDDEEAAALIHVLNRIGGDPLTTMRGKIDNVKKALIEAGSKNYLDYESKILNGALYFKVQKTNPFDVLSAF